MSCLIVGRGQAGGITRVPSRPSFSTALRKGFSNPSHLRKTLLPGVPVLPRAISLEIGGQWPVCCAGASPTEDPRPRVERGHFTQCPAGPRRCQVNQSPGSGILAGLMRSVRTRLPWLLAIALMLQLGGIVAPVVLSAAGVDVEDVCTCPDATHGATCPMHHGKTTGSERPSNNCAIRNASAPTAFGLLTLISGTGILPPGNAIHVTVQSSVIQSVSGSSLISRAELPDSPPPRG